ncbi:DegV family protein [Fusibacter sp. 3D3]|uniref:DegV family protein n=1 Tax=Fusibacter sp. 3D3 TaxID=1048380 RepID=UPI00085329EC|nr:DegV family protein [Fusibacter sp. 3D3]GAU78814.1 DegV family protein [Fusibacter sp. 3D3]
MIKLITDSTAYLPKALIGDYPIRIVSLSVLIDEDLFIETETENKVFYARMAQGRSFPKSAQPSVDEMMKAFEEAVSEGDDVIGTFLSSEMSGTYQTACMVRAQLLEKYPNAQIELIDSRTNCMQLGLCVLCGAELAAQGMPLEIVAQTMRGYVHQSRFVFLPETLDYLKMGGRIGGAQAVMGNILQILPILTVKDGRTEVLQKVRTKKKAVETLLQIALEDITHYGLKNVVVHHIEAYEEGLALAQRLQDALGVQVLVVDIGPVIGTHVGPGAIGIAYDLEQPFM